MKKNKVLYIITLSDIGGAQVHLKEVIVNLPENFVPYIIIGSDGWLADELRKVTNNIYIVPDVVRQISPINDIKAIFTIRKIIHEIKPDIVHCHSSKAGFLGRVVAKICHVPSVFTAHGWAFTEGITAKKRFVYQYLEKFAGYLSEKMICVSDYDRNLALSVMPEHKNKLITIHNGISNSQESAKIKKQVENHSLNLIMVARFSDQKDHISVLHALKILKNDNIPVHISFVGDGPNLTDIQNLTSELNVSEQVSFLGSRTNIIELLQRYDVFLLISNWEGFPISILEAMRCGLPVIASDVGGVKEAVKNAETGFFIPRGNAECLADRIKYYYLHPEDVIRMGQQGRIIFREHFTTEIMLEKILEIYQEIMDNKN